MKKILKNKKGFTLMELIIVMIIVAVLAAALIPSFLNFVSRARNDSLYAQARVGMVAAQVLITEGGKPIGSGVTYGTIEDLENAAGVAANTFNSLVVNDVDAPTGFSNFVIADGGLRIIGITYSDGTDTVTITPKT